MSSRDTEKPGIVESFTRRTVVQAIAGSASALALIPAIAVADDPISLESPDDQVPEKGLLRVTLRPPAGRNVPDELRVGVKTDNRWVTIPKAGSESVHELRLPTGKTYLIQMRASGYRPIEREVLVASALVVERVYLIPDDWPYYYQGGVEIPFEPRPALAAVAANRRLSDDEIHSLTGEAAAKGYRAISVDPRSHEKLDSVGNSVLYFEMNSGSAPFFDFAPMSRGVHGRLSPRAVDDLRGIFSGVGGRVGPLARMNGQAIRIIDSQYIIEFSRAVTDNEVSRFVETLPEARVVRASDQSEGFWIIDFNDRQNIGRHLDVMAKKVKSGELKSAEPNLLFQLKSYASELGVGSIASYIRRFFCDIGTVNDPFEPCQANLVRQRVKEAWCFIDGFDAENRYGSPSVCVATIDSGISFSSSSPENSNQDLNASALKFCYNVEDGQECDNDPVLEPYKIHGTATYGIIAARANNGFAISGIAPNTSHVAIQFTNVIGDPDNYAATLEWVGGIRSQPPPRASMAPKPPPADIINCSHGLEGIPVAKRIRTALRKLVCQGRGGRGTIVVYAAGNDNCYIEDNKSLPTLPYTIGVACTDVQNNQEKRWVGTAQQFGVVRGSNFGPYLSLCAYGQDAPSLEPANVIEDPVCASTEDAGAGVYLHGETSAAAAMVSGAAALILTVNKDLNWDQVRRILCASAEKIDCANSEDLVDCNGGPQSGRWREGRVGTPPERLPTCSTIPIGMDWYSDFYGYGRLDVLAAVTAAKSIPGAMSTCGR